MNSIIEEFIQSKRLAVVGVSSSPQKFGNMLYKELKQRGYQVFAVHPKLEKTDGDRCYPNLTALQGTVDGVVINTKPERAVEVLREAGQIGLKRAWLQQGSGSVEAERVAKELGISIVTGKCILMYAQPVRSFHKVHRFFAKIFGGL
jgi:predicted CoA-binding protein